MNKYPVGFYPANHTKTEYIEVDEGKAFPDLQFYALVSLEYFEETVKRLERRIDALTDELHTRIDLLENHD